MGIRNFIFSKNIKRSKRKVQFHNFKTAKSVAILYEIRNKSDYDIVKDYYSDLKKNSKEIYLLGFVKNKEEIGNIYFGKENMNYFSEKHISKLGKIKEVCISDFIKQEFDILINLSFENNSYIEYIFALSKANFKVSGVINCKYSDLNINYDRNKDMKYFISQINHYLSTIDKA